MASKQQLKQQLKQITNNNYQLGTQDDLNVLIDLMLKHIGALESELRDDLIYSTFSTLISTHQINNDKLKWILTKILDEDHLFYRITDKDHESVYTRTFSILIVASILVRHRKSALFTNEEIHNIFDRVIDYCKLEKDYRGYDNTYGWAHSTAHTADALDELAMCSEIEEEGLTQILEMTKLKVCIGDYVYVHEEDERLVTAVINVYKRQRLNTVVLEQWLRSFASIKPLNDYMENYAMKLNIKNFLRSLYFRMDTEETMSDPKDIIAETLEHLKHG